jgi:hypothetical protein
MEQHILRLVGSNLTSIAYSIMKGAGERKVKAEHGESSSYSTSASTSTFFKK